MLSSISSTVFAEGKNTPSGIEKDDMSKARAVLQIMMSNLTEMDETEKEK